MTPEKNEVTAQDFRKAIEFDWAEEVKEEETLKAFDTLLSQSKAQASDVAYKERNQVVAALAKCFPSVVTKTAIEGWDPAWHNCVYVTLPTGQASWHFHDDDAALFRDILRGEAKWDGHTTPEKYARLDALNVNEIKLQARREGMLEGLREMDEAHQYFNHSSKNRARYGGYQEIEAKEFFGNQIEKLRQEYNQP